MNKKSKSNAGPALAFTIEEVAQTLTSTYSERFNSSGFDDPFDYTISVSGGRGVDWTLRIAQR